MGAGSSSGESPRPYPSVTTRDLAEHGRLHVMSLEPKPPCAGQCRLEVHPGVGPRDQRRLCPGRRTRPEGPSRAAQGDRPRARPGSPRMRAFSRSSGCSPRGACRRRARRRRRDRRRRCTASAAASARRGRAGTGPCRSLHRSSGFVCARRYVGRLPQLEREEVHRVEVDEEVGRLAVLGGRALVGHEHRG